MVISLNNSDEAFDDLMYSGGDYEKGVYLMESLKMFAYSRTATLIALSNMDHALWDVQPPGYPNTIRWNAGHVYITAEDFLHKADHQYVIKHPEWIDLFIDGTRPSAWEGSVPTIDAITEALQEQEERIQHKLGNKLQQPASEEHRIRTLDLDTVDAALQFVTWHEGIHLGIIKSLSIAMDEMQNAPV